MSSTRLSTPATAGPALERTGQSLPTIAILADGPNFDEKLANPSTKPSSPTINLSTLDAKLHSQDVDQAGKEERQVRH
jgi:hypothetical protein